MNEKNQAQMEAITHDQGPMMVLAGPGSGKTTVITERTKYLIEHYGVSPARILVITFTKAAANEMKERFCQLMGRSLPVSFGTFHAVFFTILRHAYGYRYEHIISEEQKRQIIQEVLAEEQVDMAEEADFISAMINEISLVKGEMIPLENYYSGQCSNEVFQDIFRGYERKLRANRKIDFDDMLVFTYELLKEREDILAVWQKKFQYILIDEFQDINLVQYKIIQMLAKPENNLFIVGDDDQSIYRFRGAKPDIMLGFPKDYKEAKKVLLDINYRCSEEILTEAQKVIGQNEKRFSKKLTAFCGKQSPVHYIECKNQFEENQKIIEVLQKYQREGKPLEQCAVLFRTNIQPRLLIGKLMEYNLPFVMKDGFPNLFEHWIARDLITYMEIARGNRERRKILSVINRPNRYIGRDYLTDPEISFSELKLLYSDMSWMEERVEQLEKDLKMLSTMNPYASILYIRKAIGYDDFLLEYANFRKLNVEELYDVAEEIQESAKGYEDFTSWMRYIDGFSKELEERRHTRGKEEKSGIMLSTMHAAKGLEYDTVFILDVVEDMIPYKKAVKSADIAEECRMLYVAMTRAKKHLYMMLPKEHNNKKCQISRFLNEVYQR
ncbi:MAG: ATP-dependent helicase [Anaerostipes sp.]|uniref:ATP-dependent helicase n=1 Tax=Anaerostipes sp. 992a TaxID=1261637 RepID=UPI000950EFF8|nr:ATP-dependent helicase [Anaerostipes sp. 992a]MCI5952410.1 ATP-dependent helicase [Anaerostipes sp.]MDD5969749.1 ATP-dependent helicase [Anaerostipes sp.]OLR63725.1 ATP-dependent DNA helicase [Anaerostipes sp. 992a]